VLRLLLTLTLLTLALLTRGKVFFFQWTFSKKKTK